MEQKIKQALVNQVSLIGLNYSTVLKACQKHIDEELDGYFDANPDQIPEHIAEGLDDYGFTVDDFFMQDEDIHISIRIASLTDSNDSFYYNYVTDISNLDLSKLAEE